jgi:DNA repair exonuclease SbcCD ATPase subunit
MDVAPRVDQLLAKAVDEQVSEQRLIREALETVADRLERLEATTAALEEKIRPWSDPGTATADLALRVEKRFAKRLAVLEARIDEMVEEVEEHAVESLAEDIEEVGDELRKSVAELARLLVRDRGRIANTLTEHRNAIVAELRLPPTKPSNGHPIDLRDDEEDDDDAVPERPLLRRLRGL